MACPVCEHTMQGIAGANRVFWCPRCGTLKDCGQRASAGLPDEIIEGGNDLGVSEPKLVNRTFMLTQAVQDMMADFDIGRHKERLNCGLVAVDECIGSPSAMAAGIRIDERSLHGH